MRLPGIWIGAVGLAVGVAGCSQNGDERQFRTAPIMRGTVAATISATGTIEPEEVVDVGAQVAGKIKNLGPDPNRSGKTIDYGSVVEQGTVLAQIDDSIYKSQVQQARANLQRAEADILQMQARMTQRERAWNRAQDLRRRSTTAISDTDYELAEAEAEATKSALAVGDAVVSQARSSLEQAEINLAYTTIQSPVKGVIIDRRVNVGQTVVASLNAPSLFLIATDLKRLQVWAAVNEADVGLIRAGQPVEFTVDAFPNETFRGEVAQIRYNATMTQNVVTYTVVIGTDNSTGKLIPYLTANVRIEVARHDDVLNVPAAAFRFKPPPEMMGATAQKDLGSSAGDKARRPSKKAPQATDAADSPHGTIWILENDRLRPIQVEIGLSDGAMTEVTAPGLSEGMEIVVGIQHSASNEEQTTNPFGPPSFGGGKRPGP